MFAADPPLLRWAGGQGSNLVLNENAKEWFYGGDGLTADEQQALYEALGTHPIATFTTPLSRAGWRGVPSSYVYAQKDKPVPLPFAEWMVQRVRREEAGEGGVRAFSGELGEFVMECAHCTMFLVPEKVAELGGILLRTVGSS